MIYVLDANAMIALAKNEPGADVIEDYLADPVNTCFAHAVNLCEVLYDGLRRGSQAEALAALRELYDLGVTPRSDMDEAFWHEAARLKAIYRRVSLADCFALTLSQQLGGTFVTSDHHELDPIAQTGLFAINFFR